MSLCHCKSESFSMSGSERTMENERRLNDAQRSAVDSPLDVPLLILAAAGTGKTEVLTTRIARIALLVDDPRKILAVTFSNRAAAEMRTRASKMCGVPENSLSVSTFHSTCVRILRAHPEFREGFSILDVPDALKLLTSVMPCTSTQTRQAVKTMGPKAVYSKLNEWRNSGLEPDTVPPPSSSSPSSSSSSAASAARDAWETTLESLAYETYPKYRELCAKEGCVDFSDLLCHSVRLLKTDPAFLARMRERWTHVLVDEFQDTNLVQLELVELLVRPSHGRPGETATRLTVVGDDCQTIHEHAGADVNRILEFTSRFPGTNVVNLEMNYRSTKKILDMANNVVRHNVQRMDKRLVGTGGDGIDVEILGYDGEEEEADAIATSVKQEREREPYGEVCVLYRINSMSQVVERALRGHGVPYRVVGGRGGFFERSEVQDAMAYLVSYTNPRRRHHVVRAMSVPPRGIGARTIERIDEFSRRDSTSFLGAAYENRGQFRGSTLKGLLSFFDVVGFPSSRPLSTLCADSSGYVGPVGSNGSNGSNGEDEEGEEDEERFGNQARDLLERSGLAKYYTSVGDQERAENVMELVAVIRRAVRSSDRPPESLGDVIQFLRTEEVGDGDGNKEGEGEDGDADGEHEEKKKKEVPRVTLMSIHRSKGLEWGTVHVVGYAEGLLPFCMSLNEGKLEGERRLAYVAITRAKRRLILSYPRRRYTFRGTEKMQMSRFVSEGHFFQN
jgi:superfamily I DNA/RNA helicase